LAKCTQRNLIAILQESPHLSIWQMERLSVALLFKQASFRSGIRPRDSARRKQIARPQIASIACVMREQLRQRPVEITKVASPKQTWL